MRAVNPHAPPRRRTDTSADALACSLGVFSIALGAAELLAPRSLARGLGLPGGEWAVRACGAREVLTGVGILTRDDPQPWMWGRVAGDALDLGILAGALASRRRRRGTAAVALGAVAAVTALDVICARALAEADSGHYVAPDYSDRSGFPKPVAEMRGAATASPGRASQESQP